MALKPSYLIYSSAIELANMVKQKKITSSELLEKYIQQIELVNPLLNAIVHTRFTEGGVIYN